LRLPSRRRGVGDTLEIWAHWSNTNHETLTRHHKARYSGTKWHLQVGIIREPDCDTLVYVAQVAVDARSYIARMSVNALAGLDQVDLD
jgi:hypothetical protein